jgi:hypothetical protein
MTNVLVVYDRATGRVLHEREYEQRREALSARFAAERQYRDSSSIEVVVLGARTRADLLRTHARYFLSLDQLAARMA